MVKSSFQRTSQSGMALLMVVLVLAALAAIGTPFLASMRLQESGAAKSLADHKARLAARSARDHAVSHLFDTHHSRERDYWNPGENAGDLVDDLEDLQVDFPESLETEPVDSTEAVALAMRGTGDRILDARVFDEQGKVNINTAMPNLVGNLLAGSHLSDNITFDQELEVLPLDDTSMFPADDDPDTIDGVVVILNPIFFTTEAVSYTGKTEQGLTGVFRGQYLSGTWEHQKGWPVFDLRGYKTFLHRLANLSDGEIASFRTPLGIRQIADWSVVPYFLQTLAVVGLSIDNMSEWGLTPEMLVRAGLDPSILAREPEEVDEGEYREARKLFLDNGIPREVIDLVESVRGKAGVIEASEVVENFGGLDRARGNAFKGVYQTFIAPQLKRIRSQSKKYFPGAVAAYQEIYDIPDMETISAREFEKIREYITTNSTLPRAWSHEQMVEGEISNSALLGVPQMRLPRYDFFNPGTVVRIRSATDPNKVEYGLAAGAFPTPRGGFRGAGRGGIFQGGVILKEPLKYEWGEREALVSASMRHPVNINTAPARVIQAVLTGVSTQRFGREFNSVSVEEARKLTERLMEEMPIDGFEEFRNIVENAQLSGDLDGTDSDALLINALNPNHPRLSVSTTGFCYRTHDVYTIESTGVARNNAGFPEATVRLREIVEVAPPESLFLRLETQYDWTAQYSTRNTGGGRFSRFNSSFIPGRASNLIITGPIPMNGRQFTAPSLDEGTLRGLTLTVPEIRNNWGFGQVGLFEVESFSDTVEGRELEDGPWSRGTFIETEVPRGAPPIPGEEVVVQQEVTNALSTIPAMVEFWYRPRWGSRGQNHTIFDMAGAQGDPWRDRVRLFFDSETQELVLQVFDETGSALAWDSTFAPAAELRYEINPNTFADDTWYHLSAGWRSTRPGGLVLMIDRKPVGRHSWLTRLAGPLNSTTDRLSLEDADIVERLPNSGTLQIGSEAVDYIKSDGNLLLRPLSAVNSVAAVPVRGLRGTIRQNHPAGTPVRLMGYSLPLANSDPNLGLEDSSNRIVIGPGAAELAFDLQPTRRIQSITPAGQVTLGPSSYAIADTTAGFIVPGLTSTMELEPFGSASNSLLVQTQASHPFELGFPPQGYIHIRKWERNSQGVMVHSQSEFAKYSSITPGPVAGLYRFTAMGRGLLGSAAIDGATGTPGDVRLSVRGVSIEASGSGLDAAYAPSGAIQIKRQPGSQVLPGTNVVNGRAGHLGDAEWILYDRIAEGKFFIVDPDVHEVFRGFSGNRYVSINDAFRRNRLRPDLDSIQYVPAGAEIVQVVRAVGAESAEFDEVVLGDGAGNPQNRQVEALKMRIDKVRETDSGIYLSFLRPPEGTYLPSQDPRIGRFPTGKLPSTSSGQIVFGRSAIDGGGSSASSNSPATLDEVRFTKLDSTDVDTFVFPLGSTGLQSGSYGLEASQNVPSGVRMEVLRNFYRDGDSERSGGALDKMLLVGRPRLVTTLNAEGGISRSFSPSNPRGFGLGQREGIFTVDGEAMHYSFDPGDIEPTVEVLLQQNLSRDPFLDEEAIEAGELLATDPLRDLRSEVVPVVQVNTTAELPRTGGFLEILSGTSREIIYFGSANGNQLRDVLRGQLGTPVNGYVYQWSYLQNNEPVTVTNTIRMRLLPTREVDVLTRGMLHSERLANSLSVNSLVPVPAIPVARLAGSNTETEIPMLGDLRSFPSGEGYWIVDDGNAATPSEIVAHAGKVESSFRLYRDDISGRGIFRGRFGTPIGNFQRDVPVVELLARHHDHYQPRVESKDLQYLERSWTMPGTVWDRISWGVEESRSRRTAGAVRVLARFDGEPFWDTDPTNQPGGLYLFDDPDDLNQLDLLSDQLELRIYFRHREGAYGPLPGGGWNDEWKHLPVLKQLSIEHRKEWRILQHEEIPF
ncbi:MAG: hypothetical protein CBC13_00865 [Planctomycetia bacterium TMED53]|nr:MAG: hypothetical protein CBC13_00865 [Planctomycetia bacterium TMED53]